MTKLQWTGGWLDAVEWRFTDFRNAQCKPLERLLERRSTTPGHSPSHGVALRRHPMHSCTLPVTPPWMDIGCKDARTLPYRCPRMLRRCKRAHLPCRRSNERNRAIGEPARGSLPRNPHGTVPRGGVIQVSRHPELQIRQPPWVLKSLHGRLPAMSRLCQLTPGRCSKD